VPPAPPLPQAAVEKLGQGDRAFLERDYRSALFAYQDAVYLAPRNPVARVKLGRAYLALRYPAQAIAQAEQALAVDPANAEAKKLVEEAKDPSRAAAPPRAAPAPAAAAAQPAAPPAAAPVAQPAARVFRFVPDPEPAASAAAPPAAGPERMPPAANAPRDDVRAQASAADPARTVAAAPAPAAPPPGATAGQRYRAALDHLQNREFEKAIAALTEAIALDPRLAVAYAARASARFGLGKYREAAEDYRAALAFDPNLGTPVYGLAECYRVQGESRNAAEMYQRYAESRAPDVRDDLRAIAARRAHELR
jgi:tetratricopeptide (TPR) repeat protein